jgi:tetratricopeptide (TPR) repeat protein
VRSGARERFYECPAAWTTKSDALNNLYRYEEALVACERALACDATDPARWNNKGKVLYNQRRFEEALAAFEQVLALDATSIKGWNNWS